MKMMILGRKQLRWLSKSLLLLVVLFLAAYLRMGKPGITEFKRDEANLSLLALELASGSSFPLLGIGSSVGIPNSPVSVYVLAIPYFFSTNPIYATQFIGLLNVLAIALVFWVGNRYRGYVAGIFAAAFMAASPWGVIFSRKIWAQNMLPFFIMLVLCTGLLGFVDRKKWAQVAHFPLLAITGQIHYAAFVIVPVSMYLIWQGRKQYSHRAILLGCSLAVLCLVPYGLGILQADLANPSRIQEILENNRIPQSDAGSGALTWEGLRGAEVIVSGREVHSLTGPEKFLDYLANTPAVFGFYRIIPLIVVLGSIWLSLWPRKGKPEDSAILIGFWLPVVMFSINWTEFHLHYLIPILPMAFLIIGFSINELSNSQNLKNKSLLLSTSSLAILTLLTLQFISFTNLLNYINKNATPQGFGTPIHYLLPIRSQILENNTVVIGKFDEINLISDNEPTIWKALLYDLKSLQFEDKNTEIIPAASENIILLTQDCTSNDLFTTIYQLRPSEGCYALTQVSRLVPQEEFTAFIEPNTTFTSGANLLSWGWNNNCLALLWQIVEVPNDTYNFAVQFINKDTLQVASGDKVSLPQPYWHKDDKIISHFCVPEESVPSITAARLGMYRFIANDIFNSDLIDIAGNPAGQYLEISLVNSSNTSHSQ